MKKLRINILLFCDDDNWLGEENEQIGALGGSSIAYFETDPPKNILKYAGYYATGPQVAGTGEVSYPHVYGAGCTYRKSAIINLFQEGLNIN